MKIPITDMSHDQTCQQFLLPISRDLNLPINPLLINSILLNQPRKSRNRHTNIRPNNLRTRKQRQKTVHQTLPNIPNLLCFSVCARQTEVLTPRGTKDGDKRFCLWGDGCERPGEFEEEVGF